ncbi:MAG: transposase [Pseudomonadota bacterium]
MADDALADWCPPPRRSRGRPPRYSDLAIETVLLLAAAFDLPMRQAEGLARSILTLMDLDLPVPDHTTLARRRRTVALDMRTPGRTAPVDLVLDSSGLKFFGPGESGPA